MARLCFIKNVSSSVSDEIPSIHHNDKYNPYRYISININNLIDTDNNKRLVFV